MAIIPQLKLFGWNEIEQLGDLERLRLVLEYMPDEDMMRLLEEKRGMAGTITLCGQCGIQCLLELCFSMTP